MCFFVLAKLLHCGQKKNGGANDQNIFLLKKMGPGCHIIRKKNLELPYLNNRFQNVTKI